MSTADVVVVGAGLAGLSTGIALADAGARVELVARGHAATHWTPGGFDCAAPPGAATPAAGIEQLAARAGHPYGILGGDVRPGLAFIREVLAAGGLHYRGDLDDPLRAVPTAIGGTRRVGVVPVGQGGALDPWSAGERLVVCGIAGYKDFWPAPIAASLAREGVWVEAGDGGRPSRVEAVSVELPGRPAAGTSTPSSWAGRSMTPPGAARRSSASRGRSRRADAAPAGSPSRRSSGSRIMRRCSRMRRASCHSRRSKSPS